MFILGLLAGLLAATGQSLAYVFSRRLVHRGFALARLLVMSHLLMGLAVLPLLPFVWTEDFHHPARWFWPVTGTAGFYLLGQIGLFYALRHTQASRVAPLLGLKIVILAVIAAVWLQLPLGPVQWLAVALTTAAAFVLNYTGGANPPRAVAAILLTCLFYSLSDLCIVHLIIGLNSDDNLIMASVRAMILEHLFCGLLAIPLLPWLGSRKVADWRGVTPYATAWLASMFGMFAAIALVQVVLANILQSLRGILSVLFGALIARAGHHHLEAHAPRDVLIRRAIAAVMMTLGVGLYVWGKAR